MAKCINCSNFTLRDHPSGSTDERSRASARQMAALGFGRCAVGPTYRYLTPNHERTCTSFSQAQPVAIERRVTWLEGRG